MEWIYIDGLRQQPPLDVMREEEEEEQAVEEAAAAEAGMAGPTAPSTNQTISPCCLHCKPPTAKYFSVVTK